MNTLALALAQAEALTRTLKELQDDTTVAKVHQSNASYRKVEKVVADWFQIPVHSMLSKSRHKRECWARQVLQWALVNTVANGNMSEIGRVYKLHCGTVRSNVQNVRSFWLARDENEVDLENLLAKVKASL